MIERYIDTALLDYAGIEMLDGGTTYPSHSIHLEIPSAEDILNVVFLDDVKERGNRRRHSYYFGTFIGVDPKGDVTETHVNVVRKQIQEVRRPSCRKKASELNSLLHAVLFEQGMGKLVRNYYRDYWPTQDSSG